jgi:hypothetical protein
MEARDGLDLVSERAQELRFARALGGDHLDCDRHALAEVLSMPNLGHSASPDGRVELERPEAYVPGDHRADAMLSGIDLG